MSASCAKGGTTQIFVVGIKGTRGARLEAAAGVQHLHGQVWEFLKAISL